MISKRYKKVYVADIDPDTPGLQTGLFANTNFSPGDVIFIAKGTYIKLEIHNEADSELYQNALGINQNTWLNPDDTNPLRFINHSCDPNVGIKGSVTFVARKPIKKGQELTFDYSTTECDTLWHLEHPCACKSKRCRKHIGSIFTLPKKTYQSYLPYIPVNFQKIYKRWCDTL